MKKGSGSIKVRITNLDISNVFSFTVVPNHCWYQGTQYECGLSLSCVFAGAKAMDLCNGGMIWSCCVPRDRVVNQVNYQNQISWY